MSEINFLPAINSKFDLLRQSPLYSRPDKKGTKLTASNSSASYPFSERITRCNACLPLSPVGITITPPIAICCSNVSGISGGAALTKIPSNGAYSGQPQPPSLWI